MDLEALVQRMLHVESYPRTTADLILGQLAGLTEKNDEFRTPFIHSEESTPAKIQLIPYLLSAIEQQTTYLNSYVEIFQNLTKNSLVALEFIKLYEELKKTITCILTNSDPQVVLRGYLLTSNLLSAAWEDENNKKDFVQTVLKISTPLFESEKTSFVTKCGIAGLLMSTEQPSLVMEWIHKEQVAHHLVNTIKELSGLPENSDRVVSLAILATLLNQVLTEQEVFDKFSQIEDFTDVCLSVISKYSQPSIISLMSIALGDYLCTHLNHFSRNPFFVDILLEGHKKTREAGIFYVLYAVCRDPHVRRTVSSKVFPHMLSTLSHKPVDESVEWSLIVLGDLLPLDDNMQSFLDNSGLEVLLDILKDLSVCGKRCVKHVVNIFTLIASKHHEMIVDKIILTPLVKLLECDLGPSTLEAVLKFLNVLCTRDDKAIELFIQLRLLPMLTFVLDYYETQVLNVVAILESVMKTRAGQISAVKSGVIRALVQQLQHISDFNTLDRIAELLYLTAAPIHKASYWEGGASAALACHMLHLENSFYPENRQKKDRQLLISMQLLLGNAITPKSLSQAVAYGAIDACVGQLARKDNPKLAELSTLLLLSLTQVPIGLYKIRETHMTKIAHAIMEQSDHELRIFLGFVLAARIQSKYQGYVKDDPSYHLALMALFSDGKKPDQEIPFLEILIGMTAKKPKEAKEVLIEGYKPFGEIVAQVPDLIHHLKELLNSNRLILKYHSCKVLEQLASISPEMCDEVLDVPTARALFQIIKSHKSDEEQDTMRQAVETIITLCDCEERVDIFYEVGLYSYLMKVIHAKHELIRVQTAHCACLLPFCRVAKHRRHISEQKTMPVFLNVFNAQFARPTYFATHVLVAMSLLADHSEADGEIILRGKLWDDFREYQLCLLRRDIVDTSDLPNFEIKLNTGSPYSMNRNENAALEARVAIRSGYLTKQGHMVKNWKHRFFVLEKDRMRYYVDEKATIPQGEISLVSALVSTVDRAKYLFQIFDDIKQKNYLLKAASADDMDQWCQAIRTVIGQRGHTVSLHVQQTEPLRTRLYSLGNNPALRDQIISLPGEKLFHQQ